MFVIRTITLLQSNFLSSFSRGRRETTLFPYNVLMFSESVCKGQSIDSTQRQSCISSSGVPKNRNVVNTLLFRRGFAYRPTRASALAPYSPTAVCRGVVQRDWRLQRGGGFSVHRWSLFVVSVLLDSLRPLFFRYLKAPRTHSRDVRPPVIPFPVFPTRVPTLRRRRRCRCSHCHSYRAAFKYIRGKHFYYYYYNSYEYARII